MNAVVTATFPEEELKLLQNKAEVVRAGWAVTGRRMSSREMAEVVGDKEILIVELDEVGQEVFEKCRNLKVVGCCRGNPVNVDLEAASKYKVPVINAPARNAIAVAELTIAMLVILARNVGSAFLNLKQGKWNIGEQIPFTYYKGIELTGRTLGLVGFGAIGHELVKRLKGFNMEILVYDPYIDEEQIAKFGAKKVGLIELLQRSNFVSLHCKVTNETKGMIGKDEFSLMRKDAYLINSSRAVVIDKDALYDALSNNKIAGAALDVFHEEPLDSDDPILKLDNVFVTPHIGGATYDVEKHHAQIVLNGIFELLDGRVPENIINPEVLMRD